MSEALHRIALRLLLCAACSWLVWHIGGLGAMVGTAPLYGLLLARPLIDLASALRHQSRALLWRSVEGRHFEFRGLAVQVLEDDERRRWIRAADVRRIVGHTASEGALALSYPTGWRMLGKPAQAHFSEDALLTHLSKETSADSLRFRQWVEREIAFPARRQRERLGIRPQQRDSGLRE